MLRCIVLCTACLLLPAMRVEAETQAPSPIAGTIINLRGDLYQVQVGSESTVFLVTPDGIILVDPLTREAAIWLRGVFADRFPGRPVRHVILTSHRVERAEGAAQFGSAQLVGHKTFNDQLAGARRRLPATLSDLDDNGNGVLDREELQDDPRAAFVRARDRNSDGRVAPDELFAGVNSVATTFWDRHAIMLGGRTIELVYTGAPYGDASIAVHFPAERIVFVDRQPDLSGNFLAESSRPRDVAKWARAIAALPVDAVITSRGSATPHREIVDAARYLEDLFAEVATAYESGRSAAYVQTSPALAAHSGAAYDAHRAQHIAAIFRRLRIVRVGVHGVGALNMLGPAATYCASFTACQRPRSAPGAATGASISMQRVIGVAEITFADQSLAWRTSPAFDDVFAHRETIGSFLAGYASPPGRRLAVNLLGGMSYIVSSAQGLARIKPGFTGIGDRRLIERRHSAFGVTGAADVVVALGRGVDIVAPIRLTHAALDDVYWPGPLFMQAGIGFRYRVYRYGMSVR